MATDGVKIIDGDLARGTYWGIMDLYDSDATIQLIQNTIPFTRREYGPDDDFYHEIFVTSYALAFWEIGQISDEIINEVKSVIEKGACAKVWAEDYDPPAGKSRQKELNKLWKKITHPNIKIRTRKKYRQITNLYFQPDDLLVFKLKDSYYRAVICVGVYQYRGRCDYSFVPTTLKSLKKPTTEDLLNYEILGVRIGSGASREATLSEQEGVDIFWELFPEEMEFMLNPPIFSVGLVQDLIPHKSLIDYKENFEKIGILKIKESFKKEGSTGLVTDFKFFEDFFADLEDRIKIFKYFKFPVKLICEI